MEGIVAIIVMATVAVGLTAILGFVVDRHRLKESFSGRVVEKTRKYHETGDGNSEMQWVLTLQDEAGRRFSRLVTETFFHQAAVGDLVRKDPGSGIRRMT